jgi:hypothetical protein
VLTIFYVYIYSFMEKIFFFLLIMFFTVNTKAQQTIIEGRVVDKFLQTNLIGAEMFLIKREKEKPTDEYRNLDVYKDSVVIDSSGRYKFVLKDTGIYIVRISTLFDPKDFDSTYISDTQIAYRKYAFESTWIELPKHKKLIIKNIEVTVYCPYSITKDLKVCPFCLKADKICEIWYGLPINLVNNEGKIIEPEKPYCNGGCMVPTCHPTKTCLRCNKDF